jgi:hypothetical protein
VLGGEQLLDEIGFNGDDGILQHDEVIVMSAFRLQVLSSNHTHLLSSKDWCW